ncbi:hypothetical protein MRB53_038220 [Persea americana]|nr:hypothetical protein MRB53_038220 [Persea americana]
MAGRSLEDRIKGGPKPNGAANGASTRGGRDGGYSIRGGANMAPAADNPGFSIKGIGAARVKELFPDKGAQKENAGKELFGGRPRKRAEDMFT